MNEPLLLLIARDGDPAVRTLQRQAPRQVVHAAIADLSREGWRYESGRPERAVAGVGGRVVEAGRIAAVVCRLTAVAPSDLSHIHRDDREYVAAEMNAFLHAWLAQFQGIRFNEPTWTSLAGPAWQPLQWARLAAHAGVPAAQPDQWSSESRREVTTTTVVCGKVFGAGDAALVEHSSRVANAARSDLLAATFVHDGDWKFLFAHPCPQLDDESAAALLRRAFDPGFPSSAGALCGAA